MDMTGGRGPDACIDDVGMEAHAPGIIHAYDRMKQAMMMETDRPHALREAIMCCRNGGIDFGNRRLWRIHRQVSDRLGDAAFAYDQDGTSARAKVHAAVVEMIENGDIDPSFVVTHAMSLDEAPQGYEMFKNKKDGCIKIVLKPGTNGNGRMSRNPDNDLLH